MSFYSATLVGVRPLAVEIEIDLSPGLPFFQIVGLPDAVLRESRTRVKSALVQAGFEFPYDKRLVLNLAPSKVKKEGSGFELALAARILASSGQIPEPPGDVLFLGELALDGSLRSVPEIRALAFAALAKKIERIVVPRSAMAEFHGMNGLVGLDHLNELREPQWWSTELSKAGDPFGGTKADERAGQRIPELTLAERWRREQLEAEFTKLQFSPRWARLLELATVGEHHVLLCGPPGCGKTFFAESLRTLRVLTKTLGANEEDHIEDQVLDVLFERQGDELPWASPHHSATLVGLVGGGHPPRPGAVTRAHGGILFLDELLEFGGAVLDSLREPLERGHVDIVRGGTQVRFPSRFQLIGATNPCRCGHWGSPSKACQCRPHARTQYLSRLSGPLFDRFDVRVFMKHEIEPAPAVKGHVILSHVRRAMRFKAEVQEFIWSDEAQCRLDSLTQGLSFRSRKRCARVAETLALLAGRIGVEPCDIGMAVSYQRTEGLESFC